MGWKDTWGSIEPCNHIEGNVSFYEQDILTDASLVRSSQGEDMPHLWFVSRRNWMQTCTHRPWIAGKVSWLEWWRPFQETWTPSPTQGAAVTRLREYHPELLLSRRIGAELTQRGRGRGNQYFRPYSFHSLSKFPQVSVGLKRSWRNNESLLELGPPGRPVWYIYMFWMTQKTSPLNDAYFDMRYILKLLELEVTISFMKVNFKMVQWNHINN